MDGRSSTQEDLERPQELYLERDPEYPAKLSRNKSKVEEGIMMNQQPWPSLENINDSTGPGISVGQNSTK